MTHIEEKQKDFSLTGMVIHFRLRKSTNALGVHFSTLVILGKTMVMLVIPNDRSGARRQHGRSMQLGEQKGCQQRTLCREKREMKNRKPTPVQEIVRLRSAASGVPSLSTSALSSTLRIEPRAYCCALSLSSLPPTPIHPFLLKDHEPNTN